MTALDPNMKAMRDAYVEQVTKLIDSAFEARQSAQAVSANSSIITPAALLAPDTENVSEKDALAALAEAHLGQADHWSGYVQGFCSVTASQLSQVEANMAVLMSRLSAGLIKSVTREVNAHRRSSLQDETATVRKAYRGSSA